MLFVLFAAAIAARNRKARALRAAKRQLGGFGQMDKETYLQLPAKTHLDVIAQNPDRPRVEVMYPRYCCSCRLTKKLPPGYVQPETIKQIKSGKLKTHV